MKKLFFFIALLVSSCALANGKLPKIQNEVLVKSDRSWDESLLPPYPFG